MNWLKELIAELFGFKPVTVYVQGRAIVQVNGKTLMDELTYTHNFTCDVMPDGKVRKIEVWR